MKENGEAEDQIDSAIAAADAALPEEPQNVMVAQATLTRNGSLIRVVVPRDFRDEDFVGVTELAMKLLQAANEIRANRPDGLVLPDRPKLVSVDGQKLS